MCQSQEQHSPQAGEYETTIMANHGTKRILQSTAHFSQIELTKWLVLHKQCVESFRKTMP